MTKQWSLFVAWGHETTDGYVQFLWRDGKGAVQIDYTPDRRVDAVHTISFDGVDSYNGFVKWAFDCANSLPNPVFCLMTGCPECGTILNAHDAECGSEWHTGEVQLEQYMLARFPDAVNKANGDTSLAAMKLLQLAHNTINSVWPLILSSVQSAVGILREAGLK